MKNILVESFKGFYIENKNELLNNDEIISISNSLYSLYPYGTYNKSAVKEISEREEILFGFKSGLLLTNECCYFFSIRGSSHFVSKFNFGDLLLIKTEKKLFGEKLIFKSFQEGFKKFEIDLYKKIKGRVEDCFKKIKDEKEKQALELKIKEEAEARKNKEILDNNQSSILSELDKNNDGEIDLIENDFSKLLTKNQKIIIEIDKNYVHQFVMVSNYIKTKRKNIQEIFISVKETKNLSELDERANLIKNQIHTYELIIFHSINMIGALVSNDLITFYEIYESFDKLGMFKSNWENEVSDKLTNIGDKLDDLMYSIYQMESNIVNEINNLSYITQESFGELSQTVSNQLDNIDSSLRLNNLLTGIQAYQLYKINKNTKSLRN